VFSPGREAFGPDGKCFGSDGKRLAAKGSVSAAEARSYGTQCLFVRNAPCEQICLTKQVVLDLICSQELLCSRTELHCAVFYAEPPRGYVPVICTRCKAGISISEASGTFVRVSSLLF
jgi:hypothetical protein